MGDEITLETARSMIADRDATLRRKEKEIGELKIGMENLRRDLESRTPLSDKEEFTKKRMADYADTVQLMVSRMPDRKPLGSLSLFDVVRNAMSALDTTRRERDRYASAWVVCENASKKAKAIAEGRDS